VKPPVQSALVAAHDADRTEPGCGIRPDGGLVRRRGVDRDAVVSEVVDEMARVGVLCELSHVGDKTTADTIAYSKKPVCMTHVLPRALRDVKRNKPDELIKALADKGGVMGLTTVGPLVTNEGIASTLDRVLDHVDHVVKLVGIDHVGFGTDTAIRGWETDPKQKEATLSRYGEPFYKSSYRFRYPMGTEGMNDPHKLKYATAGLLRRSYGPDDILKILGGNWLRVIGEVVGEGAQSCSG